MFPWLICVIIDVAMHHVDWSMNSSHVSWYCQKHCARIFRAFQNWLCSIFPQHPLFLHQSHASLWFVARWQSIPSTFHRSHLSCYILQSKIMILMMLVMITSPVLWTKATSPRLLPNSSTPAAFSSSSFFFLSFSSCSSTCLRNSFWISGTSASGK